MPSADTLLRLQKELATDTNLHFTKRDPARVLYQRGTKPLLLELLVKTGQLSLSRPGHILDYDYLIIPTGKYDVKRGYKKCDGYFPGIPHPEQILFTPASVNDLSLYKEAWGRNKKPYILWR